MPAGHSDQGQQKGPSLLEWTAGAIGALVAAAIVTFLALEAIASSEKKPPLLEVRPTALVAGPGTHIVQVKVFNRSAQTAATVQIEGELKQGASVVETSTATIGYVPGHSERQAGLIFTRDPRRHDVQMRVTGYELP